MKSYPVQRPRRNRRTESLRRLVRENTLSPSNLVWPAFVIEGKGQKTPVASMPGVWRYSIDLLVRECEKAARLGIPAVALFPAIENSKKNSKASEAANPRGLYARAIQTIKKKVPSLAVISDVALDPYNSDGHDGLVGRRGEVMNDETLEALARQALAHARAGADLVAPSDMMDGRVGFIRASLDRAGFKETGILAYAAKYASAFYGPFRDALSSSPKKGDKKTYQMDPANVREALREVKLDVEEGADIVMVKPGLPYLDVVRAVADVSPVPVAVYNVSGEYAMLRATAERGWIDYRQTVVETLTAFRRAGASVIFTYHALEAAPWLER